MKNISNILITLVYLSSCAKVGPISGGKKDETKPKLLFTYPDSATTDFKDNKVRFIFDEFITLESPSKSIKIIPKPKEEITYTAKNNVLELTKLKLSDNTTYTVILNNAVRDITEKNYSDKLKLYFSTGPFLDSLQIKGTVVDIESEPLKDINIYLINRDDSLLAESIISEATSEEDGTFSIQGLKQGDYKLIALNDKNNNSQYDSPQEGIGFTYPFNLVSNKDTVFKIDYFQSDERPLTLLTVRERENFTEFVFNKTLRNIETDSLNFSIIDEKKKSTIRVYPKYSENQSIIKISATDSLNQRLDTVYTRENMTMRQDSIVNKNLSNFSSVRKLNELSITFNSERPVDTTRTNVLVSSTILKLDSAVIKLQQIGELKSEIILPLLQELESDTIDIKIFGEIEDLSGNKYTDTTLTIQQKELSSYGSITVIKPKIPGLILHPYLSNKQNKIFYPDQDLDSVVTFAGLLAGDYTLKIIIDQNKDGVLNTGSYYNQIQPELIYRVPEPIKLKANWDVNNVKVSVDSLLKYIGKPTNTPNTDKD